MSHNKFLFPALLALFWLVSLFIVKPIGNFPLNDDWQYARPVWFLINKGYYHATDSYSPILIAQVLWGSLFCIPAGFSFTALRFSTQVLGLLGIIVFYFLLLKASKNQKLSFLGALLLAANPFYVISANSFMTDVPFLTFALLSIYFFHAAMESNKQTHIILATLFAIATTLIRQFGLIIPLAYMLAAIVKNRPKFIQSLRYILPAIITFLTLEAGLLWLKHIGSELHPYKGEKIIEYFEEPNTILTNIPVRGTYILAYSGFFILPLFAYATRDAVLGMSKIRKIIIIALSILILPVVMKWCWQLPVGNILNTYGLGAQTLKGMEEIVSPNPAFPTTPLKIIKIFAIIGSLLVFIPLGKISIDAIKAYRLRSFTDDLFKQTFILFLFIIYAFWLCIPGFFFDRYLLLLIPLAAILLLTGIKENIKLRKAIYIGYCIIALLMGLLSSAMTRDYFEWNRTRWQAAAYLTNDLNISPYKMDGGYEYNEWTIDRDFPKDPKNLAKSWWSVDDDEYAIAFYNLEGYTVIKTYPYQNYIPHEIKNIYILHRK